ncbi:sugar kinase [Candidatus Pantoea communis]|nr:sugar kinase [Pantoea communis]
MKIAVIGECMVELSSQNGGISQDFGGDTLNTAVYLSRLLEPEQVTISYVTGLGTDPFSQAMIKFWQSEGLDTSKVLVSDSHLPGMYYIETDAKGERTFHYWRGESAARYWLKTAEGEAIARSLSDYDVIYLSGITLAILDPESREKLFSVLGKCRRSGGKICFDNNYRPRLWPSSHQAQTAYTQMLSLTDIAFLTFDDEIALWGTSSLNELEKRCLQAGVSEVVIKRGSESCLITKGKISTEVPALKIATEDIVDTTAAGDSFSAGYLAQRLIGSNSERSAKKGHQLAGTVIRHRGAIIPRSAMPV